MTDTGQWAGVLNEFAEARAAIPRGNGLDGERACALIQRAFATR
jgi:hypothetical protein